jgi:hypothetical protein
LCVAVIAGVWIGTVADIAATGAVYAVIALVAAAAYDQDHGHTYGYYYIFTHLGGCTLKY